MQGKVCNNDNIKLTCKCLVEIQVKFLLEIRSKFTLDSRAFRTVNNKLKRREGSGSTGRFFD